MIDDGGGGGLIEEGGENNLNKALVFFVFCTLVYTLLHKLRPFPLLQPPAFPIVLAAKRGRHRG